MGIKYLNEELDWLSQWFLIDTPKRVADARLISKL